MSELELTESQQTDFAVLFGTLFSLDLVLNYIDGLEAILRSKKANYSINKNKTAQDACYKLQFVIKREFYKTCSSYEKEVFEKAIAVQQGLVYSILGMPPDKQDRIRSLINKLNKE